MKGGFYGIRGTQISLTLIALICATIFIWAWDRSSLLGPSQSQLLKPASEIANTVNSINFIDSTPDVDVKEDLSNPVLEGEKGNESNSADTADGSTVEDVDVKATTTSVQQEGVSEEQKKTEQDLDGEKKAEEVEKSTGAGTPLGSGTTTSHKTGKVENTSIEHEEDKENMSDFSEEQKKSKQSLNEEKQTEQVEKPLDSVQQMNSETSNPYKTVTDKNRSTGLEEKKETVSGSSEEKKKPNQGFNGESMIEQVQEISDAGIETGAETSTYEKLPNENSTIGLGGEKACNFAKGKWIKDSKRPLYSGFGCKQWLSAMWACRLTQRTDFAYESFRWQPHDCGMPDFEKSSVLKRMQDKTLAIIGDSLGRQQFQSLMCMLTGGKHSPEVLDVGREYGLVKAHGATRPDGWAYRFPSTNTTILYYWSASLADLEPINREDPGTDWAMHLDRPPAFLRRYLHKFDVVVLNTGHHWNRGKLKANRWVMYVGGVPNTNRKIAEIGGAKNFTVYSIVKWLDSQLPQHPKLKAFLRTLSPRHFFHGDWDSGGSCDNTTPLAGGKEVLQNESSDPVASGAVKGTQVKLLDITALSELRDEGHISRYSIKATPGVQDCLHWCLPGVPDSWNEVLMAQL